MFLIIDDLKDVLKHIGLLTFILIISCKSSQKNSKSESLEPNGINLALQIKETASDQKKEFYRLFRKDTLKYKSYSVEFMLDKIDKDSDYEFIFISEYWMAFNYKKMIPKLIERITDNTEIGLTNYADLIIPCRLESGDMEFDGHGATVSDDLFKVSGRANHLLAQIAGQNFGIVLNDSKRFELMEMQKNWREWYKELKNYW